MTVLSISHVGTPARRLASPSPPVLDFLQFRQLGELSLDICMRHARQDRRRPLDFVSMCLPRLFNSPWQYYAPTAGEGGVMVQGAPTRT